MSEDIREEDIPREVHKLLKGIYENSEKQLEILKKIHEDNAVTQKVMRELRVRLMDGEKK